MGQRYSTARFVKSCAYTPTLRRCGCPQPRQQRLSRRRLRRSCSSSDGASRATSTPARLSLLRALASSCWQSCSPSAGAFGVNRRANAINDVRRRLASTARAARHPGPHRARRRDRQFVVPRERAGGSGAAHRLSRRDRHSRRRAWSLSPARQPTPISSKLSEASRLLGSYVGLVEQARANNRQGFPVGATYQRQANGIVSNADADTPDIVSSLRAVEAVAARPDQRQPRDCSSRRCVAARWRGGC